MLRGNRRAKTALVATALVAIAFSVVRPERAFASEIVQPSASPLVVSVAGAAAPAAVTIVASGFASGALVYVEQCDGVAPTAPQWSPTANCDLGSSPAPAIADAHGVATFAAADRNRAFRPFAGESPQSMFNCLAPGQRAPANGLKSFANCSLRVSTNNAAVTSDQAFLAIELTTTLPSKSTSTTSPLPPNASTTTTTLRATTATRSPKSRSKGHAPKKAAPKHVAVAAPSGTAPQSGAPGAHVSAGGSGVFALSDSRLASGYVLLLGGLAMAGLTTSLRRRSSAPVDRGDAYADAG